MEPNDVKNIMGQRGESIVESRLLDFGPKGKPLFRPARLDGKWPTTDLYVELLGTDTAIQPFFFVQVKSTDKGYDDTTKRLKVQLRRDDASRLVAIPAPTYVVGVEVRADTEAFILSIRAAEGFDTMPTSFDLSYPNLEKIYEEVLAFWIGNHQKPQSSYFEVRHE